MLNDWLVQQATQYQRKDLARTYVATRVGQSRVIGYYALSCHAISFEALPADQVKGLPRIDMPVALLGRLAVDRSAQGQGIGSFLLIDALRRAWRIADEIGTRAVEVDAIDDAARRFYHRFGFVALRDDPHHLFLPLSTIRTLGLPPPE